jgi:hypothetical protein
MKTQPLPSLSIRRTSVLQLMRRHISAAFAPVTVVLVTLSLLTAALFAFSHNPRKQVSDTGFTAHEWGTFTSIAGNDGHMVKWQPQIGSTDLPQFVEHLEGADFKGGLRGTVRMETPVLYFYSPRATSVSVHVAFKNGLITEWYPQVSKATPRGDLRNVSLNDQRTRGEIWWKSIQLDPEAVPSFLIDDVQTHYYAARETSSTPLRVSENFHTQNEKFLFYRGVADFHLPLSVTANPDGTLLIGNEGTVPVPNLIVFERRGERVGYQFSGPLQTETTLAAPELTRSVDTLRNDLEDLLVDHGLFRDEAHAMVETWHDSWFQEGTRLFYIVPESFVNSILPLDIDPAPTQLTRVFVGRVEVVTPRTEREIERALAQHDAAVIDRFGRFFWPFVQILMDKEPAQAQHLQDSLAALRH